MQHMKYCVGFNDLNNKTACHKKIAYKKVVHLGVLGPAYHRVSASWNITFLDHAGFTHGLAG